MDKLPLAKLYTIEYTNFTPRKFLVEGAPSHSAVRRKSDPMIYDHSLDRTVPIPLYYQLKNIIATEIKAGTYQPGDVIPTEEELISHFNISRTTVRQAITELVQEGRLYRVKSKGTFVAENKINTDFISRLEPFNEQVSRLGKVPSTKVLDFRQGVAPANVADALGIQPNDPIVFLQRLRYADDTPIVLVKTYLPVSLYDILKNRDFAKESLYDVMGSNGPATKVHHIHRVVEAIQTPEAIGRLLECETDIPLLFFTSTGFTADNVPVEYSRAYYRGDCNKFEITIMP